MSRPIRVFFLACASVVIAAIVSACGTERIRIPSASPLYSGAVLFSQRCSGCHTLSFAATRGSASNPRTAQSINGPNFDVRCERPVTRVLYAIENGGFSGAYMPQNVVVGQDAIKVADFVATYAGRKAPKVTGVQTCTSRPLGTIPSATTNPTATIATSSTAVSATPAPAAAKKAHRAGPHAAAHKKKKTAH